MFTQTELKHIAHLMRSVTLEYPIGHGWRNSAERILEKIDNNGITDAGRIKENNKS
jgi:hypothetical protein